MKNEMKTLAWNDSALRSGPLEKPVRVYQPNGWNGFGKYYTAIPIDILESIRAMLRAVGLKYRTYYVGHRPADSWYDMHRITQGSKRTYSITSSTTRRANARYAKLLVEDPRTGKRTYL